MLVDQGRPGGHGRAEAAGVGDGHQGALLRGLAGSPEGSRPSRAGEALHRAIAIFLSGDCKATEVPEGNPERAPAEADRAEQEADEAADEMEEEVLSVESSRLDAPAPLKLEGLDPAEVSLLASAPVEDAKLQGSLAQLTEGMGSHRFLADLIVLFVGLITLVFLWILVCGVLLNILTAVIGLVFCMIKVMIVAFLQVLKADKSWDTSFTNCMNSWAGHFYSRPGDLVGSYKEDSAQCMGVWGLGSASSRMLDQVSY